MLIVRIPTVKDKVRLSILIILSSKFIYFLRQVECCIMFVLEHHWMIRKFGAVHYMIVNRAEQLPVKSTPSTLMCSVYVVDSKVVQSCKEILIVKLRHKPYKVSVIEYLSYQYFGAVKLWLFLCRRFNIKIIKDYLIWTSVTNQDSGITVCEKANCDRTTRKVINSSGVEALVVSDKHVQPLSRFLYIIFLNG